MAQLDPAIRIIRSFDTTRLTDSLAAVKVTVVMFKVGELGPFQEDFGSAESNQSDIARVLNERVRGMREQGIIPTAKV